MDKRKGRKVLEIKDGFYHKTRLGDLLLRVLNKSKLTNREFASLLGVHESYVTLIIRGKRIPQNPRFLKRLSEALGVHLDIIINSVIEDLKDRKESSLVKESQDD